MSLNNEQMAKVCLAQYHGYMDSMREAQARGDLEYAKACLSLAEEKLAQAENYLRKL